MHSLEAIAKANARAMERDIPKLQADGKFVVAEYAGLAYTGHRAFDNETEANAHACRVGQFPGHRARTLRPFTRSTL